MQQSHSTLTVGIRPGAFRTARRKAPCIGLIINALDRAIDPTKAQRLFYRLLVTNARFSRGLLVIDQPDFLVVAMVLCQPFAPLISSRDKQGLTDFHACLFPYYFEIATLLYFSTLCGSK